MALKKVEKVDGSDDLYGFGENARVEEQGSIFLSPLMFWENFRETCEPEPPK